MHTTGWDGKQQSDGDQTLTTSEAEVPPVDGRGLSPTPGRPGWEYAALGGLLILAAVLRLWGIRWGLPDATHLFSYHPDEYHSLRGALALSTGDPNPHFFNYSSLYLYLVAFACLWHQAVLGGPDLVSALLTGGHAHAEMAAWTLNARLVVVVCAVATVGLAWVAGRRLAGPWGGVIAGAVMAVAPLHVLHSHYATVDVPQALFILLCLGLTLRLMDDPRWRNYALVGLAAGLAAGVKYNGAVVLLAPLVAHLLVVRGGTSPFTRRRQAWGYVAGMLGIMLLTFFATSPFVLLSWQEAWRDISYEMGHMRHGEWPVSAVYPNGWLFHLHPALFLVLAALVTARGDLRRRMIPLAVFTAAWWLMIGATGVRYERYAVPLEPLSALGAAALWAAVRARSPLTARRVAVPALAIWCLALTHADVQRNMVLADENVRDAMLRQVVREVPPDESVALIWEPWFNVPPVDYCNGGQMLRSNPLFARFQRPVRRLTVTGVDVEALRAERPYAVLVSDFELNPRYASVSDGHRALWEFLHAGGDYELAAQQHRPFHRGGLLLPRRVASDGLYPAPELHLFIRAEASRAP